jgi:hypothetical protein
MTNSSQFFYVKQPTVINGKKYEAYKSHRITSSLLPSLLVMQEHGQVTFTPSQVCPDPNAQKSVEVKYANEKPRKKKTAAKEIDITPEGEL